MPWSARAAIAKQKAGGFSNRNAFPTALEPRRLRSGRQDGQVLVKLCSWWGPGSSLRPYMEEGLRRPLGGLFHKSTNPIHGVSTLTTSSPPQGTPTHTITLGVRFQHVHFEGDTNIQPRIITNYMTAFIINIQNRLIQRQGVGEWGQALGEGKGKGRT